MGALCAQCSLVQVTDADGAGADNYCPQRTGYESQLRPRWLHFAFLMDFVFVEQSYLLLCYIRASIHECQRDIK